MESATPKSLYLIIQSPSLNLPTKFLTLKSLTLDTLTLDHLKHLYLPQTLNTLIPSLYFSLNGRPLLSSSSIFSLPSHATLLLLPRLAGGGGDGGATGAESRDCYLHMYSSKKPDKIDPNETRLSKWTNCSLSFEPLTHPIVIDKLGNLFNKEALVNALIHKKLPKGFGHIRGLKDMIEVKMSKFECPVTGLEFNGKYGFFAIRNCGHVLSAKAFKEVKSEVCLVCHEAFEERDKIVINGSEEEVRVLKERMEEERGRVKEKKEKKVGNLLCGSKHLIVDEKVKSLENGSGKRFRAVDMAPANASKEVYASIFTSSKKGAIKETFSCRSLPLGRN